MRLGGMKGGAGGICYTEIPLKKSPLVLLPISFSHPSSCKGSENPEQAKRRKGCERNLHILNEHRRYFRRNALFAHVD